MAELQILDDADQPITAPIAVGPLSPGQTSTPVALHVWWAQGEPGAGSQPEGAVVGLARLATAVDAYQGDSTRLQLTGGIEMRLDGGAWIALRAGTSLRLPEIAADSFAPVEFRVTSPIGAGSALDVQVLLEPHVLRSSAWSADLVEGAVLSGLGDRRRSGVFARGDVTAQSPATATVDVPAASWLALGAAYSLASGTFTASATDGAGSAIGAGEAYVSALTLGDGAYVEVKGPKATAPLDLSNRPAIPDGSPVLAWLTVDDTGVVDVADIVQGDAAGFYGATSTGLTVTVDPSGPGAVAGGRHSMYRTPQPIAVAASTTQVIYALPDSSMEVVATGSPSDPLAIPLWRVVTDASTVTDLVDLRQWSPRSQSIRFEFGSMTTGAVAHAAAGSALDVLPVLGQASLALVDNPGTSGSTDVTIEKSVPGSGSWSTIATLSVANGSAPTSTSALPVATRIDAGDILRAIVTGQTGTAQPAGGAAVLLAR